MYQLYVKDGNQVNYFALTIMFHYVFKQIEACAINSFKINNND